MDRMTPSDELGTSRHAMQRHVADAFGTSAQPTPAGRGRRAIADDQRCLIHHEIEPRKRLPDSTGGSD
jgi:hypothetical protein